MKYFNSIILFLSGVLYILKTQFGYSPLLINILNDFLAVPLILIMMQFFMKMIYGYRFNLNLTHVIVTTFFTSVLFEIVFPLLNKKCTADFYDVILYFAGAMLYYRIHLIHHTKTLDSNR